MAFTTRFAVVARLAHCLHYLVGAAECECDGVVGDGGCFDAAVVSELALVAVAFEYAESAGAVGCRAGSGIAFAPAMVVVGAALAVGYEDGAAVDAAVFRGARHSDCFRCPCVAAADAPGFAWLFAWASVVVFDQGGPVGVIDEGWPGECVGASGVT